MGRRQRSTLDMTVIDVGKERDEKKNVIRSGKDGGKIRRTRRRE